MQIFESISMAYASLMANKLRSSLTLLSISVGVFAIVGVAASVGVLQSKVDSQLSAFGSTSFTIQKTPQLVMGPSAWRRYANRKDITLRQASQLKDRMTGTQAIGLTDATGGAVVKYENKATEPDVTIVGADEAYIVNADFSIREGRSLDPSDVQSASDVVVLGADVASNLFGEINPVGRSVRINGHKYNVIGLLKAKGAGFGQSQDNFVLIPITSAAKYFFDEWGTSIQITVRAVSAAKLDETVDQAIGLMRIIRRLDLGEENDFEVITGSSVSETFSSFTDYLAIFGSICGAIALLAAGVGIMNIMLVSVKERTREIGVRKAVGATSGDILSQFVIEALTICQFGALIGILAGIGAGAGVGIWAETTPPLPWGSILVSIGACLAIGVGFGSYPAWKASRLDPIEALRYE